MPRLEIVTVVRAPVEIVFDLSRSIDVHQISQSDHGEKAVDGRVSGLIELNEEVTWEAKHFGIRQRLSSRIVSMTRPYHFRDSMVTGAFRRFDHDHYFAALPEGRTEVRDVFDYASPLGPLGHLADFLFLARYMRSLLQKRNLLIKQIAESQEYKRFIEPS